MILDPGEETLKRLSGYIRYFIPSLITFGVMVGALHIGLPIPAVQAQTGTDDVHCFEGTGYCIAGDIRTFWEQNGGLSVFGLPISAQHSEISAGKLRQIQLFERARVELHPDLTPPYYIQLSRLGAEMLEQQGRNWYAFPRAAGAQDGCRFFAETEQNVCGEILAMWQSNGIDLNGNGITGDSEAENLALFGLPLGGAMTEQLGDGREYTVQWFERARLELHPRNDPDTPAGTPSLDVLAGLLGRELAPPPPVSLPVIDSFAYPGEDALASAWKVTSSGVVSITIEQDATAADPPVLRLVSDLPCTANADDRSMLLLRRFDTPQDFSAYSSLVVRARGDGEAAEPYGGEFSVILWDAAGYREENWHSTRWLSRDAGWKDFVIALRDAGPGNPWQHPDDFVIPSWDEPVNGTFDLNRIAAIGIVADTTSDVCLAHPAMTTWIDSIVLR